VACAAAALLAWAQAAEARPSAVDAGGSQLTPVVQSVPSPPRWFRGDDGAVHIQYELVLLNTLPVPVEVTSLQVRGTGGRRLDGLSGARLRRAMTLLGRDDPATKLPPSAAGVVWLDLDVATRRAIPRAVEHRLTVDIGPGLGAGPIFTEIGGRARVSRQAPVAIGPPLRGGRWAAIVGPHRRALQAVDGHLRLAQRFAIDFSARLDDEDRTHVGDSSTNASYLNYGQPVLAVGAGTVVAAVDRHPDQIPNHKVLVPFEATPGNHVIVKLRTGVFAAYAHLKPGSVQVRRGDRVRAGQVLAELGNSGNTGGPHLHFQLMNRPSFLAADGLPFVFRRFQLDGRMPSLRAFIDADLAGSPVPVDRSVAAGVRRRGLTDLDVVTFPSE
jgi:Peptidase family M23